MLKIKLTPTGKKHERHYRIVVTEERQKITGTYVALLGHFHPKSGQLSLDRDLLNSWLAKGAQPTPTIRHLLEAK